MENSSQPGFGTQTARAYSHLLLIVLLFAGAVYLGCILSPPSLMDDVDAVQAQIAANMLHSGDWVTPRIDGIAYFEKAPLIYWLIAISYKVFGVYDWAARLPVALSSIALCWLTFAFGAWAFGKRAGFYSGLCMSTCAGLFLFTRIQIPDVMQTFTITLALWAFLRAIDEGERHQRFWAFIMAASLGTGLLLKSLIGVVFPAGAAMIFLIAIGRFKSRKIWTRLRPMSSLAIILLIAAPWHILATLRNPPYFSLSMHSAPGEYHGFLWFFFINEQLLRFLNLRFPRDYNTVPRLYFWMFHLIWLFPWSVYFPAAAKLAYRPVDRASRTRLLALCWTGFILVFFTFSTTQEYYSMPCYPALALILGSAMAEGGVWVRRGTRALAGVAGCAAVIAGVLYFVVRNTPTPGDISVALSRHPAMYTLSLGHMEDLTIASLAYLRWPLLLAGIAFAIGALGTLRATGQRAFLAVAVMMVVFFQAARIAMVAFDPYLSSRPLADAMLRSPQGKLIAEGHDYPYSSIFFYTGRDGLLLNGRKNNLVYGSYAPGAPNVFIDDAQWRDRWMETQRWYLVTAESSLPRLEKLVSPSQLTRVAASGGKVLLTNHPIPGHGPVTNVYGVTEAKMRQ